jgi:hypothetical protein
MYAHSDALTTWHHQKYSRQLLKDYDQDQKDKEMPETPRQDHPRRARLQTGSLSMPLVLIVIHYV